MALMRCRKWFSPTCPVRSCMRMLACWRGRSRRERCSRRCAGVLSMVAAKRRPRQELLHVQRHSSDMRFSAVVRIAEEEAGRGRSRSRLRRAGGRESPRAAAFACSSASSLPLFPSCPGTQHICTVRRGLRFRRVSSCR